MKKEINIADSGYAAMVTVLTIGMALMAAYIRFRLDAFNA